LSRPARPHRLRFGFLILAAIVLAATTAYGLILNSGWPV
jgi:hypothetical protein